MKLWADMGRAFRDVMVQQRSTDEIRLWMDPEQQRPRARPRWFGPRWQYAPPPESR